MKQILDVEFKKEQDYHDYEALNYSKIQKFEKDKTQLLKPDNSKKTYYSFGNYYESRLKDMAYGTSICNSDFYTIDSKPDRRTKVGKKAYEELVLESEGKDIIIKDDVILANILAENMIGMPVSIYSDENELIFSMTVEEIMNNATTDKSFVWEVRHNGEIIRKKALLDLELKTEFAIYNFDIKTTIESIYFFHKSIEKFMYDYQDVHYSEGSSVANPGKAINQMVFLVASKKDKMCRPWIVDTRDREGSKLRYKQSITDMIEWEKDGMPVQGYVEDFGVARIYG